MAWYGRRSAEMPVAIAEDSDDSLSSHALRERDGLDNAAPTTEQSIPAATSSDLPWKLFLLLLPPPLLWLLHLIVTHSNTTSNTVDGRAGLRMRRKYLRIQLLSL